MTTAPFTIVGARGLIGRAVADHLAAAGHAVTRHDRATCATLDAQPAPVGHLILAAGVTADFRQRPHDTMDAHVTAAADLLRSERFESFLYLSSTRLYRRAASTRENASFALDPADADAPYDASKVAGEALCLADPRACVRVARLSNVYAPGDPSPTFLASLVRDAMRTGAVTLRTPPESEKDFIALADVAGLLPRIALGGRQRVYNVAAGQNTRFGDLLDAIARASACAARVEGGVGDRPAVIDAPIDTTRIDAEFPGARRDVLADIQALVDGERDV